MAFRIKRTPHKPGLIPMFPSASTNGGNVSSTDIGKLAVASSGYGAINFPSTDIFGLSTAGGLLPVAGIIAAVPTNTTAGSTKDPFYVQPFGDGEILEADYTTDTNFFTQANNILATTNIGKYLRVCGAGSSSGTSATYGPMQQGAYVDVSTCATAFASSFPFQMVGYSTKDKTVDVVLISRSSADINKWF